MNPKEKLLSREEACHLSRNAQEEGKSVVFTNGCFDILHWGHAAYLWHAKEKGDLLIVGLNSDASMKRLKGKKRPVNGQDARALLIASLFFVDGVVIFEEDTPYTLIEEINPHVLVKGDDWKVEDIVGYDLVTSRGGKVFTIPLVKGLSTSIIIEKIVGLYPP